MKTLDSDQSVRKTLKHNLKSLRDIGLEYSSLNESDYEKLLGYGLAIPGMERINNVAQIHKLFSGSLTTVFFSHDAPLKRSHSASLRCDFPAGVATISSIFDAN